MMQLRHIFVFWSLFHLVKSVSPDVRAVEDIFSAFTRAERPGSGVVPQYSQCFVNSVTIEDDSSLISVPSSEYFERFVPKKTRPMAWNSVELGLFSDIRACARAAYSLGALMFKFEKDCSVALTDAYNPAAERSNSNKGKNVVYISSKVYAMKFFREIPVAGNSFGCLRRTPLGWRYGVGDGRPVNEATLPPRDTNRRSAASNFSLVAECSDEPMTYCEAEARCLARGLRPASRFFHENVAAVDPTKLDTDEYYFWVNVYQDKNEEWTWQDDGSLLSDFFWCRDPLPTTPAPTTTAAPTSTASPTTTTPPTTPEPPSCRKNCAAIHFTEKPRKIEYYRTSCTGDEVKCILCYDPNSLPNN